MKTVSQNDRIEAAKYFGIDRMSNVRHAALRLALMEQHERVHPNVRRIQSIIYRFKVADAFGFYASRPEFWRAN